MDESLKHSSNEIGERYDPYNIEIGERHDPYIHTLVEKTKNKISRIPSSHSEPAAFEKLCIFKLPKRFENVNGMWNTPQVVTIGPYNRDKRTDDQLRPMEEIKLRCLNFFIDKTKPTSLLDVYYQNIYRHVKVVRECYSKDDSKLSDDEFLEMMLVDGCFILSFLLFHTEEETSDHPLYRLDMATLRKIYRDLLLLENQIPSLVLVKLFEIYKPANKTLSLKLKDIAIKVFMKLLGVRCPIYGHELERKEFEWLHLLDIVRNIFVLSSEKMMALGGSQIPCVTKLSHVGIKVRRTYWAKNILDVSFRARSNVIHMPKLILDDEMCLLLMNCVALEEQCHKITHKPFLSYAVLLDCLVNTAKDIDYLCNRRPGIMEHIFETDAKAADFINNLGKGLTTYKKSDLSRAVNIVYQERLVYRGTSNWFRWQWKSFKQEFFGKSWLLISAIAGLVLLVLTYLQTHFTIYAYVHPKC